MEDAGRHTRARDMFLKDLRFGPATVAVPPPCGIGVEVVQLTRDAIPVLDCFICAPLIPEFVRRPNWLVQPNGTPGFNTILVLVENTPPLLPAYDRLFGIQQVTTTDTVASIRAGRRRIVFSTLD